MERWTFHQAPLLLYHTPRQLTLFEICIMCQTIHQPSKSPYNLVRSGGSPPATCLTGGDGRVQASMISAR